MPGSNFLWHIDGWDKLKTYGLCIHGCIDGFSRRVMWLKVAYTNKDPYVVCKYFVDSVIHMNGTPHIIRADRGTENVNIELMQILLRDDDGDHMAQLGGAFLYGKSTQNQRIECWWSKFKQLGMNYWIDHFKRLLDVGILDPSDDIHIQCVRYCYTHILQQELDTTRKLWNTHYIRKNRNLRSPSGKPDVIYHLPHRYGATDYLKPIDEECMGYLKDNLASKDIFLCETRAHEELFTLYLMEGNMSQPTNIEEADNLLVYLLDTIEHDI